ncbi:cohesin domain-containing protein [Neolewinella agarilytica]|uniref:Gliding motility-associated C-terminal domain-containing protein n=1 Tax=Neolewinella agarilytica TaxID=478744 RepID=A0A1H9N639_9BACT|nr:cohesin domain-containing protein [Neolewinella agarilytica]SER31446.1 gliding motility-associated C-terminal domain-containing protein [Neolewinella agarilytica]
MKNFYQLLFSGLLLCLTVGLSAQPLSVTITDADGPVGSEVCVDIIGANFTAISGLQFSISYDPAILEYVSASGNIGGTNMSLVHRASNPGTIRTSWNLFSTTGFTDAGPFTMATVCFNVLAATETQVQITDTPIPTEFTNDQNQIIENVTITNGTINSGMTSMPTCNDGIQNGNETGVDCGGPDCAACSTCSDGVQNGNETGVDCGGPDCAACPPTCSDGIQNGNETGVDCGGPDCPACPTCNDGIQNGNETGVDCGGSCAPCTTDMECGEGSASFNLCIESICDIAVGAQACVELTVTNFTNVTAMQVNLLYPGANLDFESFTFNSDLGDPLQANEFSDGEVRLVYFQGSQTGVSLDDNETLATICFTNETTASTTIQGEQLRVSSTAGQVANPIVNDGSVNAGDCPGGTTPTCTDGIQNGDETGVDCGGSCTPCTTMPTCNDGIQNGDETGVDCGGSCAPCGSSGGPNTDCGNGTSDLTLCLGDACSIPQNGQVCIDITGGNFTGVTAFSTDINFEAGHLFYQSVTTAPPLVDDIQVNIINASTIRLLYFQGSQNGVSVGNGTILGTLCFTNQTANSTNLSFNNLQVNSLSGPVNNPVGNGGTINDSSCNSTMPTCTDGVQNGNETGVDCGGPDCAPCTAMPTCNDGIMNGDETGVDCGGSCAPCVTTCGEGTTDVQICVGSECADAGAEVCIPVFVGNFNSLGGFQMVLGYNTTNLTYSRIIRASELEDGIPDPGMTVPGEIRVVWNDVTGEGVSFPADNPAFELCFTANNTTATPITFVDPGSRLRAFNEIGQTLTVTGSAGAANSNCPGTPTCTDGIMNGNETGVDCGGPDCAPCGNTGGPDTNCGMGTSAVSMCLGDACDIASGATACVDITVGNFTNVTAFNARINFSSGALTFSSITFDPALGDPIQANMPNAGELRLLYFQGSQTGVSFDNGDVIGTVCFTNNIAGTTALDLNNIQVNSTSGQLPSPVASDGSVNGCTTTMPTCSDGIQNGNEMGVDCGGPDCTPCVVMPTCSDGIMNGNETGVDCGGPDCAACPTNPLGVNVGDGTAQIGQQVCVNVTVADFTNITDLAMTLNFDPAVLQLSSVTANPALPGFGAGNFNTTANGQIGVNYSSATPRTLASNSTLFTVCWTVLTGDETTVSVTNATATNNMGTNLTVSSSSGTVNSGGVIEFDNFTIVAGDGSAAMGEEVCIDFPVFKLQGLAGLQFAVTYDATRLQFNNAVGTGELQGLQVANPEPGVVRVIWFDPNVGSNSVDDGQSILTACFTVLEVCETPIEIVDLPQFRIRATDSNNQPISPIDVVPGTINGGTGSCGGGGTPNNLVMDLTNGAGSVGEEVCIDLLVTDFTSLTELSFSVNYDESIVTFNGANNFGLGSVTTANVSNPVPGTITFDWDAASSTGQTLSNGSTLLSLCFTVDRLIATNLNFANSPVLIQARNGNGQNVGIVPSGGSINPNAPSVDGLTFQIGSAQAGAGETVCLSVIGFEAVDLIAFQYTVNYDPLILEYVGTDDDFAFRGALSVNNSLPGVLRIVWADAQAQGNSIADGSKLYSLCFRVLRTDLGIVSFGDSPTAIEFEDVNSIVNAELINGQVNGSPAPAIQNSAVSSPSCSELSDGSINLTVSGGGNLTYTWSPNVSTSANATGLGAGTYSVTITNPTTGQSTTGSYMLTAPDPFSLTVTDVDGVSCNGESDGRITIATIGGTPGYTIDWEGNLPDNILTQTGLDGGTYSVTVTDANNCVREEMNIMVGEPAEVLIGGTPISITEDPGGVNVVVQGGRMPFAYAWTGPEGYTASVEDIDDVVIPGTYCLTVADNNGCEKTQCFAVQQALSLAAGSGIVVDSGCFGEDNGSIDLTVVGGNGSYNYLWTFEGNTFSNLQDVDDLAPGDYTVMITSGTEEISSTITVEAPTQIVAPGTVTPATDGDNGAITITPSGGNPPYSFAWADGPTSQNRSNLASGEYCVTVTDDSGCTTEECYTVGAAAISFVSTSTQPSSCSDGTDGVIRLVINNGAAPFSVRVEPTGTVMTFNENDIEVPAAPGTYQVFVTDAQGGAIDVELTVGAPDAIAAPATLTSDTEDTDCSGMISLNIAGGTAPYMVSWSNEETGATISQLCAGDYTATVTDQNGCTFTTETFTVARIEETLDNIDDVACQDGTEGQIEVTISGGVEPYVYNWTRTGEAESLAATEDLMGVGPGDYTLTVSDATGAMLVRNYTVGISAGFTVNASVVSNYSGFGVSCPDATDGRIVTTISGQGQFTYQYMIGEQIVGIDSVLENAAAGVYTLTVMDDGGCEIVGAIEVTAPPALSITPTVTNVSCGSGNDGLIAIDVDGGITPYSYSWSNNGSGASIQSLSEGAYSVTVTDANQCVLVESFNVSAPEDLAVTFEATDASDGCNGSVRILPLGGSGNYRFNWPQLPNQGNDPFAEGLCPGDYEIEVTDDNGCQTVRMVATVRDRRFPCLSTREVLTPNGDGLNETLVIFCSEDADAADNNLEIYNRWGQLVFEVNDYNCSADETGTNCFEGLTNNGTVLPEGPYYYVFNFSNPLGERMQQRGSFTIIRD